MTDSSSDDLVGKWHLEGQRLAADKTEAEIARRLDRDLTFVSSSEDGWTRIYSEEKTGILWELTFVDPSLHGGGPRRLRRVKE